MRWHVSVMLFLCVLFGANEVYAQLKIDFTPTDGTVEEGYDAYYADHETASSFTVQSFSAFGSTVTVTPSWASGAAAAAMQMIDRGGDDGFDMPDLLRDWIGTDTRQDGNPLTLTVSGLPAGKYSWLSYHADGQDQTGIFEVTVNDASGSTTTSDIDISDTDSDLNTMDEITIFETEFLTRGRGCHLCV